MRPAILLLSAASLLAACSESADSTAPRSAATQAPAAAAVGAVTPGATANAGKNASGPAVTYLTSGFANIDGVTFISNVAYVTCPTGTKIVGGGYEFSYGFMNARIKYNGPVGDNVWKVLVYGEGAWASSFRAFGTCIG